jgi:hypothetical protein
MKRVQKKFCVAVACIFIGALSTANVSAQILITEVLHGNVHTGHDPDFGEFSDWIEINNPTTAAIDLTGYSISDDPSYPRKWSFPNAFTIGAGVRILLWADGRDLVPGDRAVRFFSYEETITINAIHLGFSINRQGEQISIYNASGQPVDMVNLPEAQSDVSYGRNPSDVNEWLYFSFPTPGSVNSNAGISVPLYSGKPVFSLPGGYYPAGTSVEISYALPGAAIRYTTDGSLPDPASPVYESPILLNSPTVIKARVFENGKLSGEVVTNSYIINRDHDLPVVSVSTDNKHLWDFTFGIYQKEYKNREVPVYIEYFDTLGNNQFATGAGAELFGSQIYLYDQKPLSITLKNKYGASTLSYPLFAGKNIDVYKSFVLRNGGDDISSTTFRDGLTACIVKDEIDLDYQAYQPAVMYLNGEYQGIYHIREKLNEDYLEGNRSVNPGYLDVLEDNMEVKNGDKNKYQSLISFVQHNDLSDQLNYDRVISEIDVNEFLNYMILKIYAGYIQWQVNNKYWRSRDNEGLWRWMAFDLEHAFAGNGGDSISGNTLHAVLHSESLPEWPLALFRNLMKNSGFYNEFIQRSAVLLSTTFHSDRVTGIVDSLRSLLDDEMQAHILKWQLPSSYPVWNLHTDYLKEFAQTRTDYVFSHYLETFGIEDTVHLALQTSAGGKILIGSKYFSGEVSELTLFKDIPVKIRAIPDPGYRFASWTGGSSQAEIFFNPVKDTLVYANFVPSGTNTVPDTIQGRLELTAGHSPYYTSGDIIIPTNDTLILHEGVTLLMPAGAGIYIEGSFRSLGSEEAPVILDVNPYAASGNYFRPGTKWAAICADNAQDTLMVIHTRLVNASHGRDIEKFKAAISTIGSSVYLDHVVIPEADNPVFCYKSRVQILNCRLHSQAVCDLINLRLCDSAVIRGCDLRGNYAEDADAIDLDSVTNTLAERNTIYSFFGYNSDGIDLGESCNNILLRKNVISNCNDKAFSIGQGSTAIAENNIIINCGQGFGIKDSGSYCLINKNTFYMNKHGVACFEKNKGDGGGRGEVVNSIFSQSVTASVFTDPLSETHVSYSFSDTDTLPGLKNLTGNPMLADPPTGNFNLRDNSPCIDAGSPEYSDPDGSVTDIGAIPEFVPKGNAVRINEIYISEREGYYLGDWIELFNAGDDKVDLSGWILKDKNDDHEFIFPYNVLLAPRSYLVICQNEDSLRYRKGDGIRATGSFNFGLGAENETIRLFDAGYKQIRNFRYNQDFYLDYVDKMASSLEFNETADDPDNPENWYPGFVMGGTPGSANSEYVAVQGLHINEIMAKNDGAFADEFGEFNDWIEIYNETGQEINIGGLYFTKAFRKNKLYRIPFSENTTVIPAKGFKVIWADNDREQGLLHMDFTLDAQKDELGLVQFDGKNIYLLDSLAFTHQQADISYGQYPDGSGNFRILHYTPGSSNMILDIDDVLSEHGIRIFPNPFGNYITIVLPEDLPGGSVVRITDLNGRTVAEVDASNNSGITIPTAELEAGVYFLSVLSDGKVMHATKIVRF